VLSDFWLVVSLSDARLISGYDPTAFKSDFAVVLSALQHLKPPSIPPHLAPFGVGFQVWTTPIEILDLVFPATPTIPHPAAIWLFAGKFADWIPRIREKAPDTRIFVQVGSVNVLSLMIKVNVIRKRNWRKKLVRM
jgi:hypothetical protein